ncbi:MAG: ABC transporter permease, partial [Bacteroidales bacterium]|nr:ABC transporter permease [Bacteroidales bacterium]
MIWKVLKNNIKPGQLAGTFLGVMLGLVILMGALSFYLDVKPIFDDKESFWKDEYIIINKKIELKDTYAQINDENAEKPLFSDEELADIKKQEFVKDVAEFSNCSFAISASTDKESAISGFYTDLFFEAVPDDFIDVNYDDWKWEENDQFVPAILPKVYLNLYNFGFAQSQNLPQVSEEGVGLIKFNIT